MNNGVNVAIGQIQPRKADYQENLRRVGAVLARVAQLETPPDLVVFPESVLSGYFVEGGTSDVAVDARDLFDDLVTQHEQSGAPSLDVVVGFYERFGTRVYNSALYCTLAGATPGVLHVHRKVFLPTYGLFDEERFVTAGNEIRAFDTSWGRAALAVCEDIWHSITPKLAVLDGAQVIIVPSAAPARGLALPSNKSRQRPASVAKWEALMRHVAGTHGAYVILAQLVGFEGGKGFQGSSTVVGPDGGVVACGPVFDEAVVEASLSLHTVATARKGLPAPGDLEVALEKLHESRSQPGVVRWDLDDRDPKRAAAGVVEPGDLVDEADGADPMVIDSALAEKWLVSFLRDEVSGRRGFVRVVVGLSGGVDSATTAALAVRALGKENVIGVRMPYRTSSDDSLAHADEVARLLGIELQTVDITDAVDGFERAVGDDLDGVRRGNVMARVRMITLFDKSASLNALPLGTGNKTERLLGYFTWHGDDAPPINPLGDLYKTQVRQLASHLALPKAVLAKAPTADLVPGQTDESDLGVTYEDADRILHWILRGHGNAAIVRMGFTEAQVALVRRRFGDTHWKRHLPTVAVVSDTAIGESYLRPVDYRNPT